MLHYITGVSTTDNYIVPYYGANVATTDGCIGPYFQPVIGWMDVVVLSVCCFVFVFVFVCICIL